MLKRAFDIAASTTGIALSIPVVLPLAFAMAVQTRSSPIFTQQRVGKDQKPFTIYKIKSMSDEKDEFGRLLPDDQRTSALGVILRKSRLDELPQLFNVLKGDMSMVGPRPTSLNREIASDIIRHTVKPGITGLAQISGNNALSQSQVLRLDHAYVANNNVISDLKICALTPWSLIKHRNAPHYRDSAPTSSNVSPS